jgi:hypothetical protein
MAQGNEESNRGLRESVASGNERFSITPIGPLLALLLSHPLLSSSGNASGTVTGVSFLLLTFNQFLYSGFLRISALQSKLFKMNRENSSVSKVDEF